MSFKWIGKSYGPDLPRQQFLEDTLNRPERLLLMSLFLCTPPKDEQIQYCTLTKYFQFPEIAHWLRIKSAIEGNAQIARSCQTV